MSRIKVDISLWSFSFARLTKIGHKNFSLCNSFYEARKSWKIIHQNLLKLKYFHKINGVMGWSVLSLLIPRRNSILFFFYFFCIIIILFCALVFRYEQLWFTSVLKTLLRNIARDYDTWKLQIRAVCRALSSSDEVRVTRQP